VGNIASTDPPGSARGSRGRARGLSVPPGHEKGAKGAIALPKKRALLTFQIKFILSLPPQRSGTLQI